MTSGSTAQLLDAGRLARLRDELGHRDWRELTVAEIAAAVGVSRMTLHRHGVGKDEVLVALAELLEREFRDAVLPVLAAGGTARDRLRGALASVCAIDEKATSSSRNGAMPVHSELRQPRISSSSASAATSARPAAPPEYVNTEDVENDEPPSGSLIRRSFTLPSGACPAAAGQLDP